MRSVSFNALNPRPALPPTALRFGGRNQTLLGKLLLWRFTPEVRPPHVAVIDKFDTKEFDIDGDEVVDLSHGEVIERLLKAQLPTVQITRFQAKTEDELKEQFERVKKWVGKKRVHVDAINLSWMLPKHLQALPRHTLPNSEASGNAAPPRVTFTRENLSQYKEAVLEAYHLSHAGKKRQLVESFQHLVQSQVPMFIGGGNFGEEEFNALHLFEGTVNVGATYANGKKTEYTCDNSLINRWAQGTFAVTQVPGGFDLNGDGVPEVLDSEVSGGESFTKRFVGKPLQEVLATQVDMDTLRRYGHQREWRSEILELLENRLFTLEQLPLLYKITPDSLKNLKAVGEYAYLGKDLKLKAGFTVDGNGWVQYDPDGSGRQGAINSISGTSFATPWAIGEDLKAKFPQTR